MADLADVLNDVLSNSKTGSSSPCGLWVSGSEKVVPLRLRTVQAKVQCDTSLADTTETFAFLSDFDANVVFRFPLPARAAVYKLEATIGDRRIITEVMAKPDAQAKFDEAVQQGNTAVIAKQEDSSQIFSLELGNLEAMQEAIVKVSYVRLLGSVEGACEYEHVSTWTPPYVSSSDVARGPEELAQQNPRFAGKVAYGLHYDITLLSARGVRHIETTAPVTINDLEDGAGKHVTLAEEVADPSKDFQLLVELGPVADAAKHATQCADGYASVTIQQATPEHTPVALATFTPHDLLTDKAAGGAAADKKEEKDQSAGLPAELILIVDCSGSMGGTREQQALEASQFFVQDLPTNRGIKFNIVAFGSHHITWKHACVEVTAETKTSALAWCKDHINSNLGGTEILRTFQSVYATPITPGYIRRIIFLTDGGITGSEEAAVFNLVSGQEGHAPGALSTEFKSGIQRLKQRVLGMGTPSETTPKDHAPKEAEMEVPAVLCLGIGHGVHRGLLDGIAAKSSGVTQYVVDGESIVRKVSLLRKVALSGPSIVRSGKVVVKGAEGVVAPHVLPVRLFPGEPLHVLVELQQLQQEGASIELQGMRGDGSSFAIALPLKGVPVQQGHAYGVLHGLVTVAGLLGGTSALHVAPDGSKLAEQPSQETVKAAVVKAALRHNLVTRYTAAVGVMVQKDPLDPKQVSRVEVPLAVPHGASLFQGMQAEEPQDFYRHGGPAFAACMAAPPLAARRSKVTSAAAMPQPRGLALSQGTAASDQLVLESCVMYRKVTPKAGGISGLLGAVGSAFNRKKSSPSYAAPPPPPAAAAAPGGTAVAPATGACDNKARSMAYHYGPECERGWPDAVSKSASPMEEAEMQDGAGGGAPETAPATVGASIPTAPSAVLSHLNLARAADGHFAHDQTLMRMLVSQVPGSSREDAVAAAEAARPQELSSDMWATVLALAFLSKHCAGDKSVWQAMESMAVAWLNTCWPAGFRAVAVTILSARKLV